MREIKFRGKNIDTGKWRYGQLTIIDDDYFINYEDQVYDGEESYIDYIGNQVNPDTVGQYTGLKDKTGKEIYDGDIVELIVQAGYKHKRYEIFYDNETAQYLMKNSEDVEDCEQFYGQLARVNLIVICNIYDNPKLLKGE